MEVQDWLVMFGIVAIVSISLLTIITDISDENTGYNITIQSNDSTKLNNIYTDTVKFKNVSADVYQAIYSNSSQRSTFSSLLSAGWAVALTLPTTITWTTYLIADLAAFFGIDTGITSIILGIVIILFLFTILYFLFRIAGRITN